ncbi:MAG: class I SAM-dependent methyltransferase [Prochlorococcus sp.]|jgi:SAM-dependent methyltransferase|nr:methyltransferase domain-containing protein [Prochlorococcus sp.]MDP6192837.1 methyltransferase domain-containing protein [Prochlorococcaceae cyanobacterium ETNP18_MAG_1]CAI8171855.1 MAG: putative methyltransferase [Prochlorococcus marinus str. MIT 9215]
MEAHVSPKKGWFESVSEAYSKHRPHYPKAIFDWISNNAPCHKRCWDVACGNGQASLGLAKHFDRVDATDLSPSQISSASPHPRIHYRVGAAESSDLPEASIDVIVVAAAIHWFDVPRFNAEVLRVIKPGGLMVWLGYDPLRSNYPLLQTWLDQLYGERLRSLWPPERKHVDRHYGDLPFPGPSDALPKGLSIQLEWSLEDLLGFVGTWSPLRKAGHEREALLQEISMELRGIWPKEQTTIALSLPLMGRWGHPSP